MPDNSSGVVFALADRRNQRKQEAKRMPCSDRADLVSERWYPPGFEPATCGLGSRRSILLSYGGVLRMAAPTFGPGGGLAMVEIGGLEPPTSALRTQRSPS